MIKNFTYERPSGLNEVIQLLEESEQGRVIAGGTDLLGVINEKIKDYCPDKLISLKGLGLDYIKIEGDKVKIGAMTKLSDIEDSDVLRETFPVLWQAAHQVASPQIRHMATLGGNLCQEPRCWYYRYQGDRFHCIRKGGSLCNAMMGSNAYHSVFGGAKIGKAPCEDECPNGNQIPAYFQAIRDGNIEEAAKILLETNILAAVTGRVCPHKCQNNCNRNEYDEAVSVRDIEGAVGDYIMEKAKDLIQKPETPSGKTVSIIGAGPAGLVAAFELAKAGHAVKIYDANPKAGGMLRYGIPAYRLPKTIIDNIVDILEWLGVEFNQNQHLGKDFKLSDLTGASDAVLIAIGAWTSAKTGCPGEELEGVLGGINYLKMVADAGEEQREVEAAAEVKGKDVVVIGGGNTACDVALTAKASGAANVTMVSLETREEMPASDEEFEAVIKEGAVHLGGWGPMEIQAAENGTAGSIVLKKCLSLRNEEGRFAPTYDEAETKTLKVEMVIMAIGQKINAEGTDLVTEDNGNIASDPVSKRLGMSKIFSAGDSATGPRTIVDAMADARRASSSIKALLDPDGEAGQKESGVEFRPTEFCKSCTETSECMKRDCVAISQAGIYAEAKAAVTMADAEGEAGRCMNCGCVAVSPSDTAAALVALDAKFKTNLREIPASEFFTAGVETSTVLDKNELLLEIVIDKKNAGTCQKYNKFRTRQTIDFPIAGLASVIDVEEGVIKAAKLVFSGVAPVPHEFDEVEAFLTGKSVANQADADELALAAGKLAIKNMIVLNDNRYKAQVIKAFVRRAVAEAGNQGKE